MQKIGISNGDVYPIIHQGVSAMVSSVPFVEIQPNVANITAHQRVVDASRNMGATIPVRFGVIFKTEVGIRQFLARKTEEYRSKLTMFRDSDEFGIKVVLDAASLAKITKAVEEDSPNVKRMKKEISSATEGTAYFLKMKMDETLKHETLKRVEKLAKEIHAELARSAKESSLLKVEDRQIMLNAAYLVPRKDQNDFGAAVGKLKKTYESSGLVFHLSGPWAPYSFC